jgi:serine/threonine protein kinase
MAPVTQTNLQDYLAANFKTAPQAEMCRWIGCLGAGLAYIHSRRIRHRDIKPANILVRGNHVPFTDFGIARLTEDGGTTSSTGYVDSKTCMYCAPEVAAEESRGSLADVYSLGCVFLEMVKVAMNPFLHLPRSLKGLHEAIAASGRKAYHASEGHLLQWIILLFMAIEHDGSDSAENPMGYMVEWCFAVLQPKPKQRISAQKLY